MPGSAAGTCPEEGPPGDCGNKGTRDSRARGVGGDRALKKALEDGTHWVGRRAGRGQNGQWVKAERGAEVGPGSGAFAMGTPQWRRINGYKILSPFKLGGHCK